MMGIHLPTKTHRNGKYVANEPCIACFPSSGVGLVMGHGNFGSLKAELGLVVAGLYPFPDVSQVW